MKYLSDYTEEGISNLLQQYGGFFAFSTDQFNRAKKEGITYVNCGHGLIAPKDNAVALMKGIIQVGDHAREQDIKDNGREGVIRRELYNHEAFYTSDIESTYDAVEGYGITKEEVMKVYRKECTTESAKRTRA